MLYNFFIRTIHTRPDFGKFTHKEPHKWLEIHVWLDNLIYVSVIDILAEILLVGLWIRVTGPQS